MHRRLAEAVDYVEARRQELLASFADADTRLLELRPTEREWSAAEVIDHLRIVEGGIARLLTKRIGQAKENGLRREESEESVLGALDHVGELLDRGKIEAPQPVRPSEKIDVSAAIAGLHDTRDSLRAAIASADGFALGDLKHPHPVLGEIDFYQWILFIGRHEARHTRQIARTLKAVSPR